MLLDVGDLTIELHGGNYQQNVEKKGFNIVTFKDDWCPWCKNFLPVFRKYEKSHPKDMRFYIVDRSANKEFTESQSVTTVPTIILFKDGKEVARTEDDLSDSQFGEWLKSNCE